MNSEESVNNDKLSESRVGRAHAESNEQPDAGVNELEQLKQVNEKQAEKIEGLKQQLEELKAPSSLRDTPPSQGESLNSPQPSCLVPQVSPKTQGVKPSRSSAASTLQSAAKKAAASNSRSDVHEYMRIRRNYV